MLDKEKEVQGIAIYAEFRKPGATMQIFITPDGYTPEGKEVPMALFRRVITTYAPKKQWRNSNLRWKAIEELNGAQVLNHQKEEFASLRMLFATQLFDSILNNEWILEKHPILIETSRKDLEDVRSHKTPNKLMYRINQSRDALGFPAELVA